MADFTPHCPGCFGGNPAHGYDFNPNRPTRYLHCWNCGMVLLPAEAVLLRDLSAEENWYERLQTEMSVVLR